MNVKTIVITFIATCIFCWLLMSITIINQKEEYDGKISDAFNSGINYGKQHVPKYIDLPEEISVAHKGDTLIGKVIGDVLYYEFYHDYPSQWDESFSIIK